MTEVLRSGLVRLLFVALVAGSALWGLRESGDEIASALAGTPATGVLLAGVLVLVGLLLTAVLWRGALAAYGHRLALHDAASVFFVGQLGKYVPGSVWSLGVQARMALAHQVPARSTVGASLVFLLLHVATGLVLGLALLATPAAPAWLVACGVGGAVVGLLAQLPGVVRRLAARVGGPGSSFSWTPAQALFAACCMALVWACYTAALVVLAGEVRWPVVASLCAGFALGYVAGVAVPFAPAGVGAREAVFLLVAAPEVGIATAASLAILARLLHTLADFLLAGAGWLAARHAGTDSSGGVVGGG